jgi:hypothetical protein
VIFVDEPLGFGHRVTDGGHPVAQVPTRREDFERAVAEQAAAGFEETERSLTRRVLKTAVRFWIVTLEGNAVCVHAGPIRPDWSEAVTSGARCTGTAAAPSRRTTAQSPASSERGTSSSTPEG